MSAEPAGEAVLRFRQAIRRRTGLAFADDHLDQLGAVLARRLNRLKRDADAYLEGLEATGPGEQREEWAALAEEVTVRETFFFRHDEQFQALAERAVPEMLASPGGRERALRILSAGCSTGEEPYSLAMVLEESGEVLGAFAATVTAFDLNPAAISRARLGCYPAWSLRETSERRRARFFEPSGQNHQLADSIRARVAFESRNLIAEDAAFWQAACFEVIFCRNVLMYLLPDAARAVVARLARALVPGGFLFLGHAETMRGLSDDFEICNTHGTFYYRLRERGRGAPLQQPQAAHLAGARTPSAAPAAAREPGTAWIGAIGASAQRVASLADAAGEPAGGGGDAAAPRALPLRVLGIGPELAELMRQERYAEAAAAIAALPSALREEPDSAMLLAVAHLHLGGAARAEAACLARLSSSPRDPRSHHLLGLCREQAGDLSSAAEHYRAACDGDDRFALAHLRLGMLLRRDRRHQQADAAFARALARIDGDDEMNLVLFGGGFTRAMIANLCRRQSQEARDEP
jgi:chemotaxis protein methyltransferase CheR